MRKLEELLSRRDTRDEIVEILLAMHSDDAISVRFISSHADMQATLDRKEKQMKSRKILATFFQNGSKFQLKGIPEEDLAQVRVENLRMVKCYLLQEVSRIPLIAEYVDSKSRQHSS